MEKQIWRAHEVKICICVCVYIYIYNTTEYNRTITFVALAGRDHAHGEADLAGRINAHRVSSSNTLYEKCIHTTQG